MASRGDLQDVTPEEVERISKALKDEKFRQLFFEYAQEISDPENRRKYEEEITQLEKNRGTDVVFVNPEPGYVLKTNVNGERKAFINVCKSDKVAKPIANDVRRDNGEVGTEWSVPHSLAPGREDLDQAGTKCMVYDCVFHPDCFQAAEKDTRFVKMMDDTVLNSIEAKLDVRLDRPNVKKLTKLKFKGQPRPTVIRNKSQNGPSGETDALKDFNVEYPYKGVDVSKKGKSNIIPPAKSATKISGSRNATSKTDPSGPVEPKYSIIHRGHFDMQHFTNAPDSMPTTRPQELVLKIQLPLLKSIATVQLDVFQKQVVLECQKPASYKLDLPLPYPVDEGKGAAKFDKSKSCLTIILPVLPPEIPKLPTFAPEPQNASLVEEIQVLNGNLDQTPGKTSVEDEVESKTTNRGVSPNEEGPSNLVEESRSCSSSEVAGDKEGTDNRNHQDQQQPSQEEATPQQICISKSSDSLHTVHVAAQDVPTKKENDAGQWPDYTFRQDDSTASFILQVANIDEDDLRKQISDDRTIVSLKFQSKSINNGETVTLPYSFCVVFEPQCQLEGMKMDVKDTEAVLLLHKASVSLGEWSRFKAGPSLGNLEDKLFLTEANVREHLCDMTRKHRGKRAGSADSNGMDCGVIEASDNKLVIELEAKTNEDVFKEDEVSDAALGTVTDTVVDAVIGELSTTVASLKLDLEHGNSSPGSDTSSPSTPCSPSHLRSALKDGNYSRRTQRSVSFSEDVVVETVLRSSPSKPKGKNKRHQPPRPRRFITKLRDTSQNQATCSDSEVHYWRGAKGKQQEDGDEDEVPVFQEEVVFPEWVCLDRQTSSDSSGGEATAVVQNNGKKKPKANKRQRKKMNAAKKAMAFADEDGGMKEAWFEPRHPLRNSSSEGSLTTSVSHTQVESGDPVVAKKKHHKQCPKKDQIKNLAQPEVESTEQEDKSQNDSEKDEALPLDQVQDPPRPDAESINQGGKYQNDGEKNKAVPLYQVKNPLKPNADSLKQEDKSHGSEQNKAVPLGQVENPLQPEADSIKQEDESRNDSEKNEAVPLNEVKNPLEPDADSMKQEEESQIDSEKDEKVPLELQDHSTHSAVTFSNEVMFELDD